MEHVRFRIVVARVVQGLALPFLVVAAALGWLAALIDDEDDDAAIGDRALRK